MPDPDTYTTDAVNPDTSDGRRRRLEQSSTVHGFLDAIGALVRRHRALATRDETTQALHAELIAAELDQHAAELRRSSHQFRY